MRRRQADRRQNKKDGRKSRRVAPTAVLPSDGAFRRTVLESRRDRRENDTNPKRCDLNDEVTKRKKELVRRTRSHMCGHKTPKRTCVLESDVTLGIPPRIENKE